MLAQDVRKLIPEAVTEDAKTGFLSLNSTPIFWAIVNAVKDLKENIGGLLNRTGQIERDLASLKRDNDRLHLENQELKRRFDRLERRE